MHRSTGNFWNKPSEVLYFFRPTGWNRNYYSIYTKPPFLLLALATSSPTWKKPFLLTFQVFTTKILAKWQHSMCPNWVVCTLVIKILPYCNDICIFHNTINKILSLLLKLLFYDLSRESCKLRADSSYL